MDTITISAGNARAALEKAPEEFKSVLQVLLGMNQDPQKWEDITTLEAALQICPATDNQQILLGYNGQDKEMIAAAALLKLSIIRRAMNKLNNGGKDWEPDWTNDSQYKYYPWLKYQAGSGFSDYGYVCAYTCTNVGSRLCFMTEKMARHAAIHFSGFYNDLFTL